MKIDEFVMIPVSRETRDEVMLFKLKFKARNADIVVRAAMKALRALRDRTAVK